MRGLRKLVGFIISTAIVLGCLISIPIAIEGYMLYQDKIAEISVMEKVDQLRNKKEYVELEDIATNFLEGIVAIEDHRFYDHEGMDLISFGRALLTNLEQGSFAEGGSTITQQLAKNMYFSQEKKLSRKVAELLVAFELEEELSKDEILELYVNVIYYGDGYTGIGQASHGYFGVSPSELTFDESTLLAGLPKAPSAYALSKNMDKALQRQEQVVEAMVMNDYIDGEAASQILVP